MKNTGPLLATFWVMVLNTSCATGSPSPRNCGWPDDQTEPATHSRVVEMSGDYEVIVVLEREDSDKIELRVDLTLVPNPDSLRTIFIAPGIPVAGSTAPFYGFSSLDLSALEAPNLGDVDSRNPLEPGVLLIETVEGSAGEERTSVLMRLGSHANRRGQTRFDGGYFVMQVTHLERNRFTGTWTAGLIATDATGYFCASRKPSPQSN